MLNISSQAYTYIIFSIIAVFINLIAVIVSFGGYGILIYLVVLIMAIPATLLFTYNIDCLTSGDCQIWSWIICIFACITLILMTIFVILAGTVFKVGKDTIQYVASQQHVQTQPVVVQQPAQAATTSA